MVTARTTFHYFRKLQLSRFSLSTISNEQRITMSNNAAAGTSADATATALSFSARKADFENENDGNEIVRLLNEYSQIPVICGKPLPDDVQRNLVAGLASHPTAVAWLAFACDDGNEEDQTETEEPAAAVGVLTCTYVLTLPGEANDSESCRSAAARVVAAAVGGCAGQDCIEHRALRCVRWAGLGLSGRNMQLLEIGRAHV